MNGAAPSESSVGMFVSESANVKLLRSKVEAGDGADAPAKKDGAFAMSAAAPKGGDAVASTGGALTLPPSEVDPILRTKNGLS